MSDLTAVSLFAGVEGFGLALKRCGIPVVASVEIDPDCRGVIARQFPESRLFDDVRKVTGDQLRSAGFVPERGILTGGFPCQDLSVAGRRRGLGGARSGLFWEIMRLAGELRPEWLILENVPGLLSSVCHCPGGGTCADNGRAVPGACGEWRVVSRNPDVSRWFPDVPHGIPGGACATGCMAAHGGAMGTVIGALGERGYGFSYRVLDSQHFGVPQRRERVFIVGCLGDWGAPAEILLEPEGGRGNHAAGGEARKSASRAAPGGARGPGELAPTITAGWGTNHGAPGHGGKDEAALAVTAATLQGGGRRGHRIDAEGAAGGHLIPFDTAQITSATNRSNPHPGDRISPALPARQGKGADSDATNGFILAPAVATPVAWRGRGMELGEPGIANAIRSAGDGHVGDQMGYVMTQKVTHALTSGGADASEDGTGRGIVTSGVPRPVPSSLAVAGDFSSSEDLAQTVRAANGQPGCDTSGLAVRRLTPKECERLQDFPDDWTRWKLAGGELVELSDSARYRMIGNAVSVCVPQWIVGRLVAVEQARGAESGAA